MVAEARMRPPFLAKPLWADGRDGAHGLAVVHDEGGLAQLVGGGGPRGIRLPVMLQQYVEHGGCLFKARGACDLVGVKVTVLGSLQSVLRAACKARLVVALGVHAMQSEAMTCCSVIHEWLHAGCAQIFVMGPIVVLVRRPSLRIPVDPEDVTQEVGAIQTIARISSFASEMPSDVTQKGDPPQWVVQARSRMQR